MSPPVSKCTTIKPMCDLHAGNHTFASIRGSESYDLLKNAFKDVIAEINQVISDRGVMIGEKWYTLSFILGGDYKVLMYSTPTHANVHSIDHLSKFMVVRLTC